MTDISLIDKLSPPLCRILNDELRAGNIITETYLGRFTGSLEKHLFVFLKYSFKTRTDDLGSLSFREINDRHYWKAEYTDEKANQTLACGFDEPDW